MVTSGNIWVTCFRALALSGCKVAILPTNVLKNPHIGVYKLIFFYILATVRAFPSTNVNSFKIEKGASFTHFEQKKTHISGCKVV